MFRTWTNLRGHFRPYTKSISGLTGHPRVIVVVMTYSGGFSTSKNGSFWHLLVVQVYLISNSHDSPLFKLLYGCYMDSHGSKKYFCSKLIAT